MRVFQLTVYSHGELGQLDLVGSVNYIARSKKALVDYIVKSYPNVNPKTLSNGDCCFIIAEIKCKTIA